MSKNVFKIGRSLEGQRLDRVLTILAGLSRKRVKGLLDRGLVSINTRKVVIASWEVQAGDVIQIAPLESSEEALAPSAKEFFLKVVHEDSDLLVVEKDPGISCERSPIATRPSLVSIINAYLHRKYPHLKHHYLGLVHRLDQDTSGLMVYSKTREANKIADQFKRHAVGRKYIAVVQGRVEKDQGKIESFLKKSDLLKGGRKVALSTPETGRKAVTQFRVLERYHDATLVELTLNTGRTHQIRVQMASIGHPILGDKIYGEKGHAFSRQALHAAYLQFHHPVTHQKMEFQSELPKDMRKLVSRLQLRS